MFTQSRAQGQSRTGHGPDPRSIRLTWGKGSAIENGACWFLRSPRSSVINTSIIKNQTGHTYINLDVYSQKNRALRHLNVLFNSKILTLKWKIIHYAVSYILVVQLRFVFLMSYIIFRTLAHIFSQDVLSKRFEFKMMWMLMFERTRSLKIINFWYCTFCFFHCPPTCPYPIFPFYGLNKFFFFWAIIIGLIFCFYIIFFYI